jgi:hypothetical protein
MEGINYLGKKIGNVILSALGYDVKLEDAKLEDGTEIYAEMFVEGEMVYIKGEDGNIPLPPGDYTLENGYTLQVIEEGVIAAYGEKPSEEEAPAEEEVEMEQETKPKKVVESQTKETHFEEQAPETVEVVFTDAHKEAIREVVLAVLAEQTETEAEVVKEKEGEEVEMAAVEPLKHSPEKEVEHKQKIQFGKNRPKTLRDRVRAKLNN